MVTYLEQQAPYGTTRLMALRPEQLSWTGTRKKTFIHSLPIFVDIIQYR